MFAFCQITETGLGATSLSFGAIRVEWMRWTIQKQCLSGSSIWKPSPTIGYKPGKARGVVVYNSIDLLNSPTDIEGSYTNNIGRHLLISTTYSW